MALKKKVILQSKKLDSVILIAPLKLITNFKTIHNTFVMTKNMKREFSYFSSSS